MSDLPDPKANPDLFGHQEAERQLLEGWNSGRLAHAWLISGPRGIGKATLAYRFARFALAGGGEGGGLFGGGPENLAVSPEHPVFRRVVSGGHADLKIIERGLTDKGKRRGEIVVDDVRDVGNFLSLTPAEGGWRVVVVDAADEMNRSAANALLKVLEEPPPRALLLLVCHAPGRLLPTIRSRCRRLEMKPLAEADAVKLITRAHPELAFDEAETLARLAEGSAGRAIALAEEGGLTLYREVMKLLATLPDLDITALHAFGERLGKAGAEDAFRTGGELLTDWLARMIRSGGLGQLPRETVPGEAETARRLLSAASLDRWVEVWEKSRRVLAKAEAAHLDRKQAVLVVFSSIGRAAAGRPEPIGGRL
jgi:DNA polymerase-3 subunit delta'